MKIVQWRPQPDNIYHMDALTLLKHIEPGSIDLLLTDMPYGVTACEWDTVINLDSWWQAVKPLMKPRAAVVCTATQPFTSELVMSNRDWFRYEWVWNKNNSAGFALTLYRPFIITESILVFSAQSPEYYPIMERRGYPRIKDGYSKSDNYRIEPSKSKSKSNSYYPKNLLYFQNAVQQGKLHPTQKPVALFEYLIKTYTRPGAVVLDPFIGSGTTAVAARNLGRRYIGCDISAEYVAIARKRVQNSDPYKSTVHDNGLVQKSLFEVVA